LSDAERAGNRTFAANRCQIAGAAKVPSRQKFLCRPQQLPKAEKTSWRNQVVCRACISATRLDKVQKSFAEDAKGASEKIGFITKRMAEICGFLPPLTKLKT
jgi:hypothetical protein